MHAISLTLWYVRLGFIRKVFFISCETIAQRGQCRMISLMIGRRGIPSLQICVNGWYRTSHGYWNCMDTQTDCVFLLIIFRAIWRLSNKVEFREEPWDNRKVLINASSLMFDHGITIVAEVRDLSLVAAPRACACPSRDYINFNIVI